MDKLADFGIFEVHYDKDHCQIEEVKVANLYENGHGPITPLSRMNVIIRIGSMMSFVTVYKKNGIYVKGEDVRIIALFGRLYIRTDGNHIEQDNLGELPEY